jgi:hypothetical protein
LIDVLQSRMSLREHDVQERYSKDDIRGVLTHFRKTSPLEVEGIIRRFTDNAEFSKLKCLFFSIQSEHDLKKSMLGLAIRL